MNNENSNFDDSEKILKVSDEEEIPKNYTGIVIWSDGDKWWLLNGKLHRTDGPAFEHPSGYKAWYLDGKHHRTDGPAREFPDGSKSWFLNGELHRTDGPAVERADGYKAWFLNGVRINEP